MILLFNVYLEYFPSLLNNMDPSYHHVLMLSTSWYLIRNTGKFKDWMVEVKKGDLITESYVRKLDVKTKYDYHSKVDPKLKKYYEFYNY